MSDVTPEEAAWARIEPAIDRYAPLSCAQSGFELETARRFFAALHADPSQPREWATQTVEDMTPAETLRAGPFLVRLNFFVEVSLTKRRSIAFNDGHRFRELEDREAFALEQLVLIDAELTRRDADQPGDAT